MEVQTPRVAFAKGGRVPVEVLSFALVYCCLELSCAQEFISMLHRTPVRTVLLGAEHPVLQTQCEIS
eukprot:scaffold29692_cov18-Tisochrysis_lutea.AAC.4